MTVTADLSSSMGPSRAAESRDERDHAMQAMIADPAFKDVGKTMPADGKPMFMGGFKVLQAF